MSLIRGATGLDRAGAKFTMGWEGGQSSDGYYRAYYDSAGSRWTIGAGDTEHDGRSITPGMIWTPEETYDDLIERGDADYAPVINDIGRVYTQNQFNAAFDALWNLGAGAIEWDWGKAFAAGYFDESARLLRQYDRAGGVVYSDLTRRRIAEGVLMTTPEPKPIDPHHYAEYPDARMTYKGNVFHERSLAQDIDLWLNHPHIHREKLQEALTLAHAAKTRIWVISVYEKPSYLVKKAHADWGDHRGERYQWWAARINAVEKALLT
jgi:GH24 family phage-related lysozyme (muramidase)